MKKLKKMKTTSNLKKMKRKLKIVGLKKRDTNVVQKVQKLFMKIKMVLGEH